MNKVKYKICNISDNPITFCGKNTFTIPGRSECAEKVYEFTEAAAKRLLPRLRRYHSLQISLVREETQPASAATAKTAAGSAATAKTEKAAATKTADKAAASSPAKETK